ncbi:hypothetical protein BV378_01935 [Nostoc sp. RF31YmG]|nr:hypothetical protein BV378_01935 [Nostoc sp. RF31YmG]
MYPLDLCPACHAALPWMGHACYQCALPLPVLASDTRCGSCQQTQAHLSAATATFLYQWPVDILLRRFKFHGDLAAGRVLALLMSYRFVPASPDVPVLVPVPLHADRLRHRGYDQAAELARPLAFALGIKCCPLLARPHATAAQSSLVAASRLSNVREAFQCVAPAPVHVVLVDDVMTTGATLQACAAAVRRAGALRVDAWVCARVP